MSCPANKKRVRFLFWSWTTERPHKFIILYISRFMSYSKDFIVEVKCTECGVTKEHHFVEPENLLRKGISIMDIDAITADKRFYVASRNIKW